MTSLLPSNSVAFQYITTPRHLIASSKSVQWKNCMMEAVEWSPTTEYKYPIRKEPSSKLAPLIQPLSILKQFDKVKLRWTFTADILLALGMTTDEYEHMIHHSKLHINAICMTVISTLPEYTQKTFQVLVRKMPSVFQVAYVCSTQPEWHSFLTEYQNHPQKEVPLHHIRFRLHNPGTGSLGSLLQQWCSKIDEPRHFMLHQLPHNLRSGLVYQTFEVAKANATLSSTMQSKNSSSLFSSLLSIATESEFLHTENMPSVETLASLFQSNALSSAPSNHTDDEVNQWRESLRRDCSLVWQFSTCDTGSRSSTSLFYDTQTYFSSCNLFPYKFLYRRIHALHTSPEDQERKKSIEVGIRVHLTRPNINVLLVWKMEMSHIHSFMETSLAYDKVYEMEKSALQSKGLLMPVQFLSYDMMFQFLLFHIRNRDLAATRRVSEHLFHHPDMRWDLFTSRFMDILHGNSIPLMKYGSFLSFWTMWVKETGCFPLLLRRFLFSLFIFTVFTALDHIRVQWPTSQTDSMRTDLDFYVDAEVEQRSSLTHKQKLSMDKTEKKAQSLEVSDEDDTPSIVAEEVKEGEQGAFPPSSSSSSSSSPSRRKTTFDALVNGEWDWKLILSWRRELEKQHVMDSLVAKRRVVEATEEDVHWWISQAVLSNRSTTALNTSLAMWASRWGLIPPKVSLAHALDSKGSAVVKYTPFQLSILRWSGESNGSFLSHMQKNFNEYEEKTVSPHTCLNWKDADWMVVPVVLNSKTEMDVPVITAMEVLSLSTRDQWASEEKKLAKYRATVESNVDFQHLLFQRDETVQKEMLVSLDWLLTHTHRSIVSASDQSHVFHVRDNPYLKASEARSPYISEEHWLATGEDMCLSRPYKYLSGPKPIEVQKTVLFALLGVHVLNDKERSLDEGEQKRIALLQSKEGYPPINANQKMVQYVLQQFFWSARTDPEDANVQVCRVAMGHQSTLPPFFRILYRSSSNDYLHIDVTYEDWTRSFQSLVTDVHTSTEEKEELEKWTETHQLQWLYTELQLNGVELDCHSWIAKTIGQYLASFRVPHRQLIRMRTGWEEDDPFHSRTQQVSGSVKTIEVVVEENDRCVIQYPETRRLAGEKTVEEEKDDDEDDEALVRSEAVMMRDVQSVDVPSAAPKKKGLFLWNMESGNPFLCAEKTSVKQEQKGRMDVFFHSANVNQWMETVPTDMFPPYKSSLSYVWKLPGTIEATESVWAWSPLSSSIDPYSLDESYQPLLASKLEVGHVVSSTMERGKESMLTMEDTLSVLPHNKVIRRSQSYVNAAGERVEVHMDARDQKWWDELAEWTVSVCSHLSVVHGLIHTILHAFLTFECQIVKKDKLCIPLVVRSPVPNEEEKASSKFSMNVMEINQILWCLHRLELVVFHKEEWIWSQEELEAKLFSSDSSSHVYINHQTMMERESHTGRSRSLHLMERIRPFLSVGETYLTQWSYFLSRCLLLFNQTKAQSLHASYIKQTRAAMEVEKEKKKVNKRSKNAVKVEEGKEDEEVEEEEVGAIMSRDVMYNVPFNGNEVHVQPKDLIHFIRLWNARANNRSADEVRHIRYAIWKWLEMWPTSGRQMAQDKWVFHVQHVDIQTSSYPWAAAYINIVGHLLMMVTGGLLYRPNGMFDVSTWKLHPRTPVCLVEEIRLALLQCVVSSSQFPSLLTSSYDFDPVWMRAHNLSHFETFRRVAHDEKWTNERCLEGEANIFLSSQRLSDELNVEVKDTHTIALIGRYMGLRERIAQNHIQSLALTTWQKEDQSNILLKEMQYRAVILANETGMGKTISELSAVLARTPSSTFSSPSLIITPIISPYLLELLKSSVFDSKISYYIHHPKMRELCVGGKRYPLSRYMASVEDLERHKVQIVITTYTTLSNEWKMRQGSSLLWQVYWYYIIAGEASEIKNVNSDAYKATASLEGEFRMATTATPHIKDQKDTWALVQFLRLAPYGFDDWIHQYGKTDLSRVLQKIMIRRKKRDLLDNKRTEVCVLCPLTPVEEEWHKILQSVSQYLFQTMDDSTQNIGTTSANLFSILLRTLSSPWAWGKDSGFTIQSSFRSVARMQLERYEKGNVVPRQILKWMTRHLTSVNSPSRECVTSITYDRAKYESYVAQKTWVRPWIDSLPMDNVNAMEVDNASESASFSVLENLILSQDKYSMCGATGKSCGLAHFFRRLLIEPLKEVGTQLWDNVGCLNVTEKLKDVIAGKYDVSNELKENEIMLVMRWLMNWSERRQRGLLSASVHHQHHTFQEEVQFFVSTYVPLTVVAVVEESESENKMQDVDAPLVPGPQKRMRSPDREKDPIVIEDDDEEPRHGTTNDSPHLPPLAVVRFFEQDEHIEENGVRSNQTQVERWTNASLPSMEEVEILVRRGWIELKGPFSLDEFVTQCDASSIPLSHEDRMLCAWMRIKDLHNLQNECDHRWPHQKDIWSALTLQIAPYMYWEETILWRETIQPILFEKAVFDETESLSATSHKRTVHAAEKTVLFFVHKQTLWCEERKMKFYLLNNGIRYTVATKEETYGFMTEKEREWVEQKGPLWSFQAFKRRQKSHHLSVSNKWRRKNEVSLVSEPSHTSHRATSKPISLSWTLVETKLQEPIYRWSVGADAMMYAHEVYMCVPQVRVIFSTYDSHKGANLNSGRNDCFFEMSNDVEKNIQAKGRVDRVSTRQDVFSYRFKTVYMDGTPTLEHIQEQILQRQEQESIRLIDSHAEKSRKATAKETQTMHEAVEYFKLLLA